jgi:hypothetical protein
VIEKVPTVTNPISAKSVTASRSRATSPSQLA